MGGDSGGGVGILENLAVTPIPVPVTLLRPWTCEPHVPPVNRWLIIFALPLAEMVRIK